MTSTITTYRLHKAEQGRVATATTLRNGKILQVYPVKKSFDNVGEWRAEWPQCDVLKEESRLVRKQPKNSPVSVRRRNKEVMEFFEPEYQELFQKLEVVAFPRRSTHGEPYVHFDTHDGAKWSVFRSLNFLEAPKVWKNGERYCNSFDEANYSPALTAVRWWMMLAFTAPELSS